jgi:hypothetical protein
LFLCYAEKILKEKDFYQKEINKKCLKPMIYGLETTAWQIAKDKQKEIITGIIISKTKYATCLKPT